MKYLYSWIKELSGTKLSPQELADKMTTHAFEVEEVKKIGGDLEGVVVGHVLEVASHPDADRLNVAKVDVGSEELQIVCGAPNLSEGQKVPVALVGTVLPGDFKIKKSKIRGVESCGMICAEDELGIGDDHEGIMVLSEDAKVGENFSKELDLKEDYIIDLDILSNRGHDVLCHVGMARELSALEGKKFDFDYEGLSLDELKKKHENQGGISVEIENNEKCKRYTGVLVEGIEVKESPRWIQEKLVALGMKPINNIVDATNYVMLELGQPMHAFDADVLRSGDEKIEISVKSAKDGEKMILLDDSEKELKEDDIIISGNGKSVALAGIMGAKNSGVTENTKNILIESANFEFLSVRLTRMRLGLKTDSSDRFEKELDPNLAEKAMARILEIIKEVAGGEVKDVVDVYENKVESWNVEVDLEYVNSLLGCEVPKNKIISILKSLQLEVENESENSLNLRIPTFRIDLQNQEDIIEEIGRVYGYEHVESQELAAAVKGAKIDEHILFERKLKGFLAGSGFSEVYSYSFYSKKDAENIGIDEKLHFQLERPMNPNQELMQLSLIPNVLKVVSENLKNFDELRIFEFAREYWKGENGSSEEKKKVVGAVVLESDKKADGFFETKGYVESLIEAMGIDDAYFDDSDSEIFGALWHKSRTAHIKVGSNGETLGTVGEIDPLVLEKYSIKKRVVVFEIDLSDLQEVSSREREYEPVRKYPTVTRDISMLANSSTRVSDILNKIQNSGGDLILDVDLFDIFEIEGENKNSFAFHIILGHNDRTLEGKEVEKVMERVMNDLESDLGVEIRR